MKTEILQAVIEAAAAKLMLDSFWSTYLPDRNPDLLGAYLFVLNRYVVAHAEMAATLMDVSIAAAAECKAELARFKNEADAAELRPETRIEFQAKLSGLADGIAGQTIH